MAGERWLFTQEQLANTPSRKTGIDNDKEIYYRQQAANFIQDMGQRLQVTQLCINTAIVYLHRFYMFHSFTKFHRNNMAEACLFLAAKVEEQPRKLEHIIKMAHTILHRDQGPLDTKSVAYLEHAQELVINENILLQTLGFELQVDHPHTHIVKTCQLIRAAKDLAQTSYFLATNSLHLTQMSLQNKPTFVACVCIHLACKWAQFEIPRSNEGKDWFFYVDKNMTAEILEDLTQNFLAILDKCPSKFKKKLMSKSAKDEDLLGMLSGPPEKKPKIEPSTLGSSDEGKQLVNNHEMREKARPSISSPLVKSEKHDLPAVNVKTEPQPKAGTSSSGPESSMRRVKTESYLTSLTPKDYFERKERERAERERIEKERQQLIEKEKRALHKQAEKDKIQSDKASAHPGRQHTNIFEEMATGHVKNEPIVSMDSSSMSASQPKENHSVQRSHTSVNYKDKYHEKEQATRKLPFSVDVTKLREDQRKPSSYRHQERKGESVREPGSSGRHTHEPKHKSHVPHSEHRGSEHRSRVPQRHDPSRFPLDEPRAKPQPTEPITMNKVPVEVPKPTIDPEEGEIIDDDSPPLEEPKDLKKAHSSHGYHHHHRERKSSGHRHHSPGAAVAAPVHQEREPAVNAEGRVRRRSPRNGRPSKDEPPAGTPHERKATGPRHDLPITDVEKALSKPMDFEIVSSRAISEASVVQRATPEPGEIVERSHKHGHHKSSHNKSHKKDKHRDREHPVSSDSAGGLKIKLDLKGVGRVSTPTKHSSPGASVVGDETKKELKLKIKPLTMMHDIPDFPAGVKHISRDTPTGSKLKDSGVIKEPHAKVRDTPTDQKHREASSSSKNKEPYSSHRDNTPNLKMKLKLPSSSTPAGNGQTSSFKPDGRESSDSLQSPGSRSIKLVLSKDNLGHYMPTPPGASTSSSSHKHHRHSSGVVDKGSSRKRPFSPSEGSSQRHKLARNDSLTNVTPKFGGNDFLGDLSGGSLTGSPHAAGQVATPSKESIEQSIGMLQQLIEQTQGQIIQRGSSTTVNPSSGSHRRRSGHSATPTDKPITDV